MTEQNPNEQVQKVALPAYLPQRMQAFRIGSGDRQSYVVRDKLLGKSYDFEPWQFFTLEVLPGCEEQAKLASVFEDRFGYPLPIADLQAFFASLADANLLDEQAKKHPLLAQFATKTYEIEDGRAKVKSFRAAVENASRTSPPNESGEYPKRNPGPAPAPLGEAKGATRSSASPTGKPIEADTELPAGVQDAVGLDPRAVRAMWVLFNPTPLLRVLTPLLTPFKVAVYFLPLVALAAVFVAVQYRHLIEEDMVRLLAGMSFFEHAAISMVTLNLLVTFTSALLAFKYRATVSGIGIVILLSFLPRFAPRIGHVEQLARNERMWLHAGPLLVRITVFSFSVLTWYATRHNNGLAPQVALVLGSISLFGLLISANPLIKSSGYYLLAAFTNEPHLRGRAFRTVLNRLKGNTYRQSDDTIFATYAILSVVFMAVVALAAAALVGTAFAQLHLGGTGLVLMAVIAFVLLQRLRRYFAQIEAAYERSLQFDRWRKRTLPAEVTDEAVEPEKKTFASFFWRAAALCVFAVMFLPYSYTPGGSFIAYPMLQQTITSDASGVIREVYFDGGEFVKQGTVIARLDTADQQAQVDVLTAKMAEQQAVIDELKSRPRREDVELAERALEVEEARVAFSKAQVARAHIMYDKGAISLEELEDARREYEVDLLQVEERRAALQVAKMGAPRDEIQAAIAKLESLRTERDAHTEKVQRTALIMPFDGTLLDLRLKEKGNAYYNRGDTLATVEQTGQVTIEIEVPEPDMEYVRLGAIVRARPTAYSTQLFEGKVDKIDSVVTEKPFGNVVKVIAVIDNPDGRIKNGMSGYAKIDGPSLPVWQAFSQAVMRFVNVQVWSWVP